VFSAASPEVGSLSMHGDLSLFQDPFEYIDVLYVSEFFFHFQVSEWKKIPRSAPLHYTVVSTVQQRGNECMYVGLQKEVVFKEEPMRSFQRSTIVLAFWNVWKNDWLVFLTMWQYAYIDNGFSSTKPRIITVWIVDD
jgi:hypothetical protein